ncbi:MAG: ABC transporter substrate-binding protein, partial [Pseudonocardiaceae bacterium]
VDYVPVADPSLLGSLRSAPGISLKPTVANGNGALNCQNLLTYNLQTPPLAKLEVRQAFAYAIDRQRILDQVQFGQGAVSKGPIASAFAWAQDPNAPIYPRDVNRANALLDQAGYPRGSDGIRFALQMKVSGDPRESAIISQNLAEVGVHVKCPGSGSEQRQRGRVRHAHHRSRAVGFV